MRLHLTLLALSIVVHPVNSRESISRLSVGYYVYDPAIPHGNTEILSHYSSAADAEWQTRICMSPGCHTDASYHALYMLHGIGGDIRGCYNGGAPHHKLGNLLAKARIVPMVDVLTNGRAMAENSPGSGINASDKQEGFSIFEFGLIAGLVPFIDSNYAVKTDRESRAIAGLSMGEGQALIFSLAHPDTFAWVEAFSPAPNTEAANQWFPDIGTDTALLKTLRMACGSYDGLLFVNEDTRNYMEQKHIRHNEHIEAGQFHTFVVWKRGLCPFSKRISGISPVEDTDAPKVFNDRGTPEQVLCTKIRIQMNEYRSKVWIGSDKYGIFNNSTKRNLA